METEINLAQFPVEHVINVLLHGFPSTKYCTKCEQVYFEEYDDHIKRCIMHVDKFLCKHCTKYFYTNIRTFREHYAMCSLKYEKCERCNLSFRKTEISYHNRIIHKKRKSCKICKCRKTLVQYGYEYCGDCGSLLNKNRVN
jgi:hypothetical protein